VNISMLKVGFVLLSTMLVSTAQAQQGGDGSVETTSRTARKIAPLCAGASAACPSFPKSLSMKRDAFKHAIEDLTGCAEHTADERTIFDAGSADTVSQALSHMVLVEAGLSLHAKKMAIEMLARLDAKASADALETIFARSVEIVTPRVTHRSLTEQARQEKVAAQAEERRRIVVLAAAKRADSKRLVTRAAVDPGRSVSLTAQRLSAK